MNVRLRPLQLIAAAVLLSWAIVGTIALPELIRAAYRGESWPMFNDLIRGQSDFPVGYYLRKWYYWFSFTLVFLTGILLYIVLPRPYWYRRTVRAVWTEYFFAPTPVVFLDVTRLVCVALQLWLLTRAGQIAVLEGLAQMPDEAYAPLPILQLFMLPWGLEHQPSTDAVLLCHWFTVAIGFVALIGLRARTSLLAFALGNTFLQAYIYSFGEIHHRQGLMIITLWLLALGPAGRCLSLDSVLAGAKSFSAIVSRAREPHPLAAWPLRVVQVLFAIIYADAASQKLFFSGFDWLNGTTLRFYLLRNGLLRDSEIALWLGSQSTLLLQVLSWVSILFEAGFWLVLFVPRLVPLFLLLGLGFHIGNAVMKMAPFYQFMALYIVFLPQLLGYWKATPITLWRRFASSSPAATHALQHEGETSRTLTCSSPS